MRFVKTLAILATMFTCMSMNVYAQDAKTQLHDQCLKYKKDAAFCECAMGTPYEELAAKQGNSKTDHLLRHLTKLEENYRQAHDIETSKGRLTPRQIERICEVVDEYQAFLETINWPYKIVKIGKNNVLTNQPQRPPPATKEQRQALTLKRTELNKKIHDLNHEYQRGGAMGSFTAGLERGVCVIEDQIEWLKEEIELQKKNTANTPAHVGVRKLLAHSMKTCGGY